MKLNDMPSTKKMTTVWLSLCLALLVVIPASALEPRTDVIHDLKQWPMYNSPVIGRSTNRIVHSPELIPLWLVALKSDELDLQRQVADTIVIARQRGVEGLEKMIPALLKILHQPEPHPTVLASTCRALVALDHRAVAPRFLELARQGNLHLSSIVEPGLAVWKEPGAIQVWRERLVDPGIALPLSRLAIRCLAEVEDTESIEALDSIAVDSTRAVSLRIEAARAVAQLASAPRIASASELKAAASNSSDGWINRLVSAWLLSPVPASEALQQQVIPLVRELALDEDGSIAAVALDSLMAWNVEMVAGLAPQRVGHGDAQVRSTIADALFEVINAERVSQLAGFLEDPHQPTRLKVRGWLIELLADDQLGPVVAKELTSIQPLLSWRGIEQLLWIMVEVPEVADREWIPGLIDHYRPEVFITSVCAARRLKVTAALPVMLKRAKAAETQLVKLNLDLTPFNDDMLEQVCHIFQAFGEMNYKPAETLMVKSIALNTPFYPFRIRASAAWAIGFYYVDNPDERIVGILEARVAYEAPMPPEGIIVKRMAAISLARMNSVESIPLLERYFYSSPPTDFLKWTCAWAMGQLGKEIEEKPDTIDVFSINWFLEPIND